MKKIIIFVFIALAAMSFKKKQVQPGIIDSGVKFSTASLSGWFDASNKRSFNSSVSAIYCNDLKNGVIAELINGASYDVTSKSFILDRVNDYISFYNNYNFTSQDFSFNIWASFSSFTSSNGSNMPVLIYKGNYNTNGYYMEIFSSGVAFYTCQGGATQYSSAVQTLSLNTWYNFCVTRSGSSVRIYINGIDKTSTVGTHINPASSSINFTIGSYGTNFYMGGKVRSFFVYTKQLSATEVLQNYNALKNGFN